MDPVSQSKWATLLVPVPKKDGVVRICGDYKPTVNTQIEIAHYPMPTVELITVNNFQVEREHSIL